MEWLTTTSNKNNHEAGVYKTRDLWKGLSRQDNIWI